MEKIVMKRMHSYFFLFLFLLPFLLFINVNADVCFLNTEKDFQYRDVHDDIYQLQKFLNNNGFVLSNSGPGSIGNETNYFGLLTRQALIKFQEANNLEKTGILDLDTKSFLGCKNNNIFQYRDVHDDIYQLQKFLNNNGFVLSNSGPGSIGNETNYFGLLTRQALIKFQEANNLAKTGILDLDTRKKINNYHIKKESLVINEGEDILGYYSVGGQVMGLIYPITIKNEGVDDLIVKAGENSFFTFPAKLLTGQNYNISVYSKNSNQRCSVKNNVGIIGQANVENIIIECRRIHRNSSGSGLANITYTLNYLADSNGSVSGGTTQTVNQDGNGTEVTAIPNAGYHFISWSDGCLTASRTDINVTGDISVTASFEEDTSSLYTLTYVAGSGGSITGTSSQTVNAGEDGLEITAVPDTGRHFIKWSDDIMTAIRTDVDVSNDLTVTAEFAINTYDLIYTVSSGGTISGINTQTVNFGTNGSTVTAVPSSGYHFVEWSDHIATEERTDLNVSVDLSVAAVFEANIIVTVTAINPTSGYNTDSINLTSITGTGFLTGATIKLTKTGQSDIPCSGFTVVSLTSITGGVCHIASATAGIWNVVVTNTDTGSGVLIDGFTVQEYMLGNTGPAGGLIFYVNSNYEADGWKYLEAATIDQHDNIDWWDDYTTSTGATGTAIGTGLSNTNTIIGTSTPGNTSAVAIAYNYSLNGYTDWFLPSIGELNLMRDNLYSHTPDSLGDFEGTGYWSSSEVSGTNAYRRSFTAGVEESKSKSTFYNIRVARRFSTTATYNITYDGNGNTGGLVPVDTNHYPNDSLVSILSQGTLVKDGHKFMGWNTLANGTSTHYDEGDNIIISSAGITLYAEWEVDFYITVFPDTQSSVNWKRAVVTSQVDWIINNKDILDIRFVGHVGDLVAEWENDLTEWSFIQDELGQLKTAGIPYATLPGNHDYAQMTRDNTLLNSYFPLSNFSDMTTYGGSYDTDSDNTYHILDVGGKKLLIMSLEFGPRDAVVAWANEVLQTSSTTKAIIITHAYINTDGELLASGMDHAASNGYNLGTDVNDGDELWDELIYPNNNVAFVICGHDGTSIDGSGRKESTHANDAPIHQFLTNYQYYSPVGDGSYFFLLHFMEDSVEVRTYSSYLNRYKTDSESQVDYSLWSF